MNKLAHRIETALTQAIMDGKPMTSITIDIATSVRVYDTWEDIANLTERMNLAEN